MNDFERIPGSLRSADVAFVIIGGVEAVAELELIRDEKSRRER